MRAKRHYAGNRGEIVGFGVGGSRHHHGGSSIIDGRCIGRSDRAVLLEGRTQLRNFFITHPARRFVLVDHGCFSLRPGDFDRCDFRLKLLGRLGGIGPTKGLHCKRILFLSRKPVVSRTHLRAVAHVFVTVRIPQAIVDHRVDHLLMTDT